MARERILIAEDNEKNLKLFRDVLQVNGFETLEATTGEDAIELATQNDPILILMDIRLAGIDGVAALHRLREEERTASIPVIALTAQAMAGDRERFLETGFDDYMSKPVNVREFLAVVQRHCEGQGDG
jgi:two-component system, cell cycle response regulator DivK